MTFEIVSHIADIAGIIGCGISLYLLYAVRKIRSFYTFTARTPELLQALKSQASILSQLNRNFAENENHIDVEIAKLGGLLSSLSKKLDRPEKKLVKATIALVEKQSTRGKNDEHVWEIYKSVQKVLAHLDQLVADRKWEQG